MRMEEGVVAFLDALGVKGIWAKTEPETIIISWRKVLDTFYKSIREAKREAGHVYEDSHIAAFSDTVIVTLKGKDPARLIPLMAEIISSPFFVALLEGIYFRGVISVGKFYQTQTFIIGPAVDEAADWYTQPDWIGVSTAPSASLGLERAVDQGVDISKWFVKYDIPMKYGIENNGWALAWPKRVSMKSLEKHKKVTGKTLILMTFANRPISVSEFSKYKNTLSFFDFVKRLSRRSA